MLGIIKLVASPYQSLAPIVSNPAPLALGLTKLGEALRDMWSWGSDQDVYDPEEPLQRVDKGPIQWEPEVGSKPVWGQDDEDHLADAFMFPLDTDSLIDDFAQSTEGNCALVATIKAAMRKFGNRLFRSVRMPAVAKYQVGLRDGSEVKFGYDELALTRESAGLSGKNSPVKAFATFAFTVAAARRAQLMPAVDFKLGMVNGWLSDQERFQRALDDLNSGHRPRHCAHYLGVGHELRIRTTDSEDTLTDESTIVSSFGHAVFVQTEKGKSSADHYGHAVEYDGTDTNGRPIRQRLTFEGPGLNDEDGWFYI